MKILAIFLMCLCIGAEVYAAEIIRVGSSLQVIAITREKRRPWVRGDRVCVIQARKTVECGEVMKTTKFGAIVKLDAANSYVARGDTVRVERAARAEQEPDAEAEEQPKEHERDRDREVGMERRQPAAALLESKTSVEGMQTPNFNLSGGINVGLNFFSPMLHFQFMLSPYVSIGIMPMYFHHSVEASSVGGLGGFVTLNYYGNEHFRGFWGQLGGGAYRMTSSETTPTSILVQEESMVPSVLATVGWRGYWDLGMNVGVGAGVQYIGEPHFDTVVVKATGIRPVFQLDVGFSF